MHEPLKKCNQKFSLFSLSSQKQLTRLHITCQGTIEDDGYGMLQVHFFQNLMAHLQKPSVPI